MAQYEGFIPQNTAPLGVKCIGVYNSNNKRVGIIELGGLAKEKGEKLYSFGAISDVHLQRNTGTTDFPRALTFFKNEGVSFVCINGDLTQSGTIEHLEQYKQYVDTYSQGVPIYAISGNHETYGSLDIPNIIETYTGKSLYYSFTQGDDVFIMLGIKGEVELFTSDELSWFESVLNANKNKRCFVFMHVLSGNGKVATCGNAYGAYHNHCWSHATQPTAFINLLKANPNTIWFHGHSHFKFAMQSKDCEYANCSEADGYKSVHIPSVTVPRTDENLDGTAEDFEAGSEGYVVDVYESGIHLRGYDFVKGEYLPVASYWIE